MKNHTPALLLGLLVSLTTLCSIANADVSCRAVVNKTEIQIPQTSEDADHIYYSGHSGSNSFDATYHKSERFIYLQITTGDTSAPTVVNGSYVMDGIGLPANLSYKHDTTLLDFICQN